MCDPSLLVHVQIIEMDDALEIVWHICLNNGASRISKAERYDKSGEVMEGPRRDGRPGILRSQLTVTPEGHVHLRCVPFRPATCMPALSIQGPAPRFTLWRT